MFDLFRTHYIAHVYQAMKFYMEHHPELQGTAHWTQLADIRDSAKIAFEARDECRPLAKTRQS